MSSNNGQINELEKRFQDAMRQLSAAQQMDVKRYIEERLRTAVRTVRKDAFADELGNPSKDGGFTMGQN